MVKGWKEVRLGDVADLIDGDRGSNYPNENELLEDGYCIFLNAKNVTKEGFLFENKQYISKEKDSKLRKGKLAKFDLVLTTRGTVGNIAIYDEKIPYNNIRINSGMLIIRVIKNELTNKFLYLLFNSDILQGQIKKVVFGSAQPQLTVKEIEKFALFYPTSKTEQEKIAKILTSIDNMIEVTSKIVAKQKRIKTGLMQDLLTYGIDESGNIRSEETHEFKDSPLGRIPIEWEIKTMNDICFVRQGLQIDINKRFKEEKFNRYKYITIQYLNNPKNIEFIENPQKELICNKNDILFTRTGNTGQIITNVVGVYHNNFFKINYYKNIIDKDFLIYFLKYKPTQNKIKDLAGSTTIPDLNHKDFYSINIAFPTSQTEQQKIASILSKQDEVIEKEEAKLKKLKRLKTALMQDLLTAKVRVSV